MTELNQIRDQVNKASGELNAKLDVIISRNAQADKEIAVLKTIMAAHDKADENEFMGIKEKHGTYDKLIYGTFGFVITELFVIVGYLLTQK